MDAEHNQGNGSPMKQKKLPDDLVAALKKLNTKSVRKAMKKGDRKALKDVLQRAIGKVSATAPSAAWAEWIASGDNSARWPIKGMVLSAAFVIYLGRSSRRFTPSLCADMEDMLDLMTPKEADRYVHPSSCGSLVTYAMLKTGYRMKF